MPQPHPLARSLDQPRQVRHHELPPARRRHPQVRLQRRERIRRHPRPRRAQLPQQRRLPRVRQPHQPDVRHQLQLQPQPRMLPRLPLLRRPRRLVHRTLEVRVPVSPRTAPGRHDLLPVRPQIGQPLAAFLRPPHDRPDRHLKHQRRARLPAAVPRRPRSPRLRAELPLPTVPPQRVQLPVRHHDHVPPAPTAPSVRPAPRHELLPPERHRPAPTVARDRLDLDRINHAPSLRKPRNPNPPSTARDNAGNTGDSSKNPLIRCRCCCACGCRAQPAEPRKIPPGAPDSRVDKLWNPLGRGVEPRGRIAPALQPQPRPRIGNPPRHLLVDALELRRLRGQNVPHQLPPVHHRRVIAPPEERPDLLVRQP